MNYTNKLYCNKVFVSNFFHILSHTRVLYIVFVSDKNAYNDDVNRTLVRMIISFLDGIIYFRRGKLRKKENDNRSFRVFIVSKIGHL